MSAITAMFFDGIVFIATDTLATTRHNTPNNTLRPLLFVPKVFHLPHLKCVFAGIGDQVVSAMFYEFITQKFIGRDINSIVNVGLDLFQTMINASERHSMSGSIYLYGYDDREKKFKGFRTHIGSDRPKPDWIKMRAFNELPGQQVILMSPPVDDYYEKASRDWTKPKMKSEDFVSRMVIIQKDEDDQRDDGERVGVGGDVVLTMAYLSNEGNLTITSEVRHEFADKEADGFEMLNGYRPL